MSSTTRAVAWAAGIGLSAIALIGLFSEPVPVKPDTLPAVAPLAEQQKTPAASSAPEVATSSAAASKPAAAPKSAEPKAITAPAVAQPKPQPASSKSAPMPLYSAAGDRDCADFGSHEEAQRFFLANGGPSSDPHKLDRDHDGLACESN